jgi:hypothetical protein
MEFMTEPIVRPWMQGALDNVGGTPINWVQPSDIKTAVAYVIRNHVGIGSIEPSPSTDLYPSWYKEPKGASTASTTIDIVSNKTATSCTPDLAKKTEGGSNTNLFSVDVFDPRGGSTNTNATSTENDDVHNCNDAKPTITLNGPASCNEKDTDCDFTVAVTQGSKPLSGGSYTTAPAGTIIFTVDGTVVDTKGIPTENADVFNWTFNYKPTKTGNVNVQVQVVDSVLYSASQSGTVAISN